MMKAIAAITGALLVASGSGLAAQQHRHGQGSGQPQGMPSQMGQMGTGPGMALRAYHPDRLLEQRDTLGLTADQVTRLEAIAAEARTAYDQAMATHDHHRQQMTEVIESEHPDPDAVQTHFMGAHAAMGTAHWAAMDAGLKAMAVLTDAQRSQVKAATPRGGMQHRHGQGGQGMR